MHGRILADLEAKIVLPTENGLLVKSDRELFMIRSLTAYPLLSSWPDSTPKWLTGNKAIVKAKFESLKINMRREDSQVHNDNLKPFPRELRALNKRVRYYGIIRPGWFEKRVAVA